MLHNKCHLAISGQEFFGDFYIKNRFSMQYLKLGSQTTIGILTQVLCSNNPIPIFEIKKTFGLWFVDLFI